MIHKSLSTLDLELSLNQSSSIVDVVPTGFVATSSTAATITGTLLIETPQAISVITADEMVRRDVQTLSQTLDYTAGVA
jgi:iron complex outermembrane receptor protein